MKQRIVAIIIVVLVLSGLLILNMKTSDENIQRPTATVITTAIQTTNEITQTQKVLTKKATKKKSTKKKKNTKKKTTKKKKSTKKKKTTSSAKHSIAECKSFAYNEVINRYHWSESNWNALVKLWNRESGWKYNDKYGTCYGIPQACPGSKMKSAGSDWKTNCYTQINWGLGYIASRYGNPSKAWKHSQKTGWY